MDTRSLKHILCCFIGLLPPLTALADTFVGRVLDETGNPLPGAVVRVDGLKQPFVTDADGRYSFELPGENKAGITVSFNGYIPKSSVIRSSASRKKENVIRVVPDPTTLNEVVVTATRTPKSLKDVPVVTRVISADDIAKTDATDIQDLLIEEMPGLEFGYAMSQETSLNMSGFGGNAVLFLVDGERLAGETMDNVDYGRLNLTDVGRVEIIKGASSALYGANAVGGVVNLISRESTEPWHLNVNTRYRGAGREWRNGGSLGFNSGRWSSNTSVLHSTKDAIRLADPFDTESKIHEIYGGSTFNIKERLTCRLSDRLRLTARGSYFSRASERSNYDDHYHAYSGGLRGVWDMDKTQNLELSYAYDQYDKARYAGGRPTSDHDYSNRQHILHALYSKHWGKNALTAGADYMHDYLKSYQFTGTGNHSQTSVDAFVQFDYNPLSWLNVIASVRDDYFSASGHNAVTSRIATMFKLRPLSIRASYSGGFRAPTLKEMYMCFDMAGIQMIYGNPDLKPERSHNLNLALERNGQVRKGLLAGLYSLTLSGYYNYYGSRITTTDFPGADGMEAGAVYANENGVKVTGMDLNARYRTTFGLGASVSYNYLHVAGRKLDSQFSQPRPHSATWRIDYERQFCGAYRLYAGLSGRYMSKAVSRYDTDDAYALWKLTVRQHVWRGMDLNVIVDNLFDYKPKTYYWNSAPTAGITWSVGLSIDVDDFFK